MKNSQYESIMAAISFVIYKITNEGLWFFASCFWTLLFVISIIIERKSK